MPNLLFVTTSARRQGSISHQLAEVVASAWAERHGAASVVHRDLTREPLPHLDEATVGAFFTPPPLRTPALEMALSRSDSLVYEVRRADVILIASPMYNLTVTSHLKTWLDHVIRAGITFKYTPEGPSGLLKNKRVVVATARGGVFLEGPAKEVDHQQPYLQAVFRIYMGITDVRFVTAEGFALGPDAAQKAIGAAMADAGALAATL